MRALALLALAAGLASPALAEKADREKEIAVVFDKLTADDANRTSTFEGNVVVTQGTMRITASKVIVREDAQRNKFYVATGEPVTFRQKRDNVDEYVEGYAERAEFDDRNDMLKLFNKARVKSNQNQLTGEFISYDMRRELAEVTGGPPGQVAPAVRPKVIFVPAKKAARDEKGEEGKAPPLELKQDPGKR
jgi:lipopolysaccharide export system protein LptA